MKFKIGFLVLIFVNIIFFSCKNEKKKQDATVDKVNVEKIDKDGYLNLLNYQIPAKNNYDDIVNVDITGVKVKLKSENTYQFVVDIKGDFDNYDEYYILINLYPQDNELDLLNENRKKYGFESFSGKIFNKNDRLYLSREIKTKISFPRAVTISIVSYKDKNKIKEIVLQNADFIN